MTTSRILQLMTLTWDIYRDFDRQSEYHKDGWRVKCVHSDSNIVILTREVENFIEKDLVCVVHLNHACCIGSHSCNGWNLNICACWFYSDVRFLSLNIVVNKYNLKFACIIWFNRNFKFYWCFNLTFNLN